MKTLKQLGEFNFINRIAKFCEGGGCVIKGVGDDAAVINLSKNKYLLFTTDMLLEDVHFRRNHSPQEIGHKAVACSISDIAAMGGVPEYALISVGLPAELRYSFIENIYQGMKKTARNFGVKIVGGDTNCSEKIIIGVFICGIVERKNLVLRSGAQKGDYIFVTGSLGGSLAGRHLRFIPRLKEARFLVANYKLNAMIDISDGLVQDLNHILKESKAGAILFEENIPLSPDAVSLSDAYYSGEDFELLFSLPEKYFKRLVNNWPFKKTGLSYIGEIVEERLGLKVKNKNGQIKQLKIKGYKHF